MYASARDMAVFLTANLGELPDNTALQKAMRRAQLGAFPIGEGAYQALAWEVRKGDETIVDKYGGMNNASDLLRTDSRTKNRRRHSGKLR